METKEEEKTREKGKGRGRRNRVRESPRSRWASVTMEEEKAPTCSKSRSIVMYVVYKKTHTYIILNH